MRSQLTFFNSQFHGHNGCGEEVARKHTDVRRPGRFASLHAAML